MKTQITGNKGINSTKACILMLIAMLLGITNSWGQAPVKSTPVHASNAESTEMQTGILPELPSFINSNETAIPDLLRLKATTTLSSDETIVYFRADATDGFDPQYDAYKLDGSPDVPQLSSIIPSGTKLSINSLPTNYGDKVVPLNFTLNKNSEVVFNASGMESFNYNTTISLDDLITNNSIDLLRQPEYVFNYETGQIGRFQLRFSVTTAVNKYDKLDGKVFFFNRKCNIQAPSMEGNQVEVCIFDIAGRQIKTADITLNGVVQIDAPSASGIYIVKVISGNKMFSKKLVVN
jgi:hypothetical protein